jgi:hypothetical protein
MFIYLFDALGILAGPVSLPEVPGLGVQVPGNAVELDEPLPAPDPGQAWALVNAEPVQLADHRGLVYSTDTGAALEWGELGELPSGYTALPCPGAHYVWSGGAWVLDAAAAALAQRDQLLVAANQATAGMANAYIAGLLDDADTATFKAFAAYQLALNKIEQQPGYPATIAWPPAP